MDEESTIATLQGIVAGAMYALAGLTEIIKAQPEAANVFAKGLLLKDAEHPEPKPAISLATLGAALYIHKLAEGYLAEQAVEEAAQETDWHEGRVIVVPKDPQLH